MNFREAEFNKHLHLQFARTLDLIIDLVPIVPDGTLGDVISPPQMQEHYR